mmetsp:Transcript_39659/g.110145  ORF Transcript_39659/g.110145 Transcript_39659/m.110145 type:complete len:224 (-) Transcript_39659:133-804(-)
MADRAQLPIQHRHNLLRAGVLAEDHIVRLPVAMDDARLVLGHVGPEHVQQRPEGAHGRHHPSRAGDLSVAGAAHCRDLPLVEAAEAAIGTASLQQAQRGGVVGVQPSQRAHDGHHDASPFFGNRLQQGVVDNGPPHKVHDVERGAQHRLVFAEQMHSGHLEADGAQSPHDAILAVDGVGTLDQLSWGPFSKHVLLPGGGLEQVSRVGLAVPEFCHRDLTFKAG